MNLCKHVHLYRCDDCGEHHCELCFGSSKKNWEDALHKCPETIKICEDCHLNGRMIPLIWTFAFNGSEYWCPFCGKNSGMIGAGEDVAFSKTLWMRRSAYESLSREFLKATGTLVASGVPWNGEIIHPTQLPEHEKNRRQEVRDSWKFGVELL